MDMQGNRILLAMVAGFSVCAMTTPALAIMSTPCGWYIEGNLGSGHLSDLNLPGDTSSSGLAGNVNLGYKFMPYFAAEVGYFQFSETEIKNDFGTKAAKVNHYAYDLAAKGIVPIIDSGFELFAKAGIERNIAKTTIQDTPAANALGVGSGNHSTTGVFLGVGGQYYIMPELAVNVQWQRAKGNSNTGTLDLYSAGISFIFY